MLPVARIENKLSELCVGLAAACDPPKAEKKVAALMRKKFAGADSLPYVAWVTHDMKWVHGFWGARTADEFYADLLRVEKSPVPNASPADQKKLAAIATKAGESAEKGDWKSAFAGLVAAGRISGRSPSRETLSELRERADAWAAAELDACARELVGSGDRTQARKALRSLGKVVTGTDHAAEVARGLDAVKRHNKVGTAPPERAEKLRAQAQAEFAGTRWEALFTE